MKEPAVRARHLKTTIAGLDALPERDAIRALVPAQVLAEVSAANGFDWLPIAHDLALVRAGHGALGAERHAAFARSVILAAFHGPLLGRLVEAGLRLVHAGPGEWAAWVPKAWSLMFEGCGTWTVTRPGPGRAELRLAGMAPACAADPVWPGSVANSLGAVVALAGRTGNVTLERLDVAAGEAVYAMRWEARRQG